ncbi:hypothetical protein P9112_001939 [Eukaryota sp. TZLM1-RC]
MSRNIREGKYEREVCGEIQKTERKEETVCRPVQESKSKKEQQHYQKSKVCRPVDIGRQCEEHAVGPCEEESRVVIEPIYKEKVTREPFMRVTHSREAISSEEAAKSREVVELEQHECQPQRKDVCEPCPPGYQRGSSIGRKNA